MKRLFVAVLAALSVLAAHAQKISADPTASALAGGEYLAGVQSGANVKILPSQILTYARAGLHTVNAQTGTTYTYLSGDIGKLVTHSNGSSIAGTLPQATGSFGSGWFVLVQNRGAGTLTITPTTSTIDGASTLVLATNQGALILSDGTNYYTARNVATGGTPAGSTKQVQYNNAGAFGAEAGFEYDAATDTLTVVNATTSGLALTAASGTGSAGLRVPHGAAPSSPTNGDVWTTTAGLFVRVNGATVGPLAAGGSLTNFTEAVNTSTPNATIPITSLTATNAATNVDFAIVPKGTGAIVARIADNGTTNGNKRGTNAVDLQRDLNGAATSVASGISAFIGSGIGNRVEGAQGVVAGGNTNWTKNNTTATIGGGTSNTVSGNYGVVSGGQSNLAGTNANAAVVGGTTNTASGTSSFVGGGDTNVASNSRTVVAGGITNTASAISSAVLGGESNTASGAHAVALGGFTNLANAQYSATIGAQGSSKTMIGALVHSSYQPLSGTQGERQARHATMQANTTNATPGVLTVTGGAAAGTNQFILSTDTGLCLQGKVIMRGATSGDVGRFTVDACWKNVSGTVSLSGTPVISAFMGDASLNTTAVAAVADNTNKTAQISITGIAATNIKWAFEGWSVEVGQ